MSRTQLKAVHTFLIVFFLNIITATPANFFTASPNTTTQTVPINGALGVNIPVDLQWGGTSGSVDIEIVSCSVDAPRGSINLDNYQLDGTSTSIVQIIDDLSGVTYNPLTNTLFMVENGGTTVFETTLSGAYLRNVFLFGFEDTEGIVHISGTRYAVTEERKGRVTLFDMTASSSMILYNNSDYVQLASAHGPWGANVGLEGVSYDPVSDEFHTVKEKTSKGYYSFSTPTSYPIILSASNTNVLCNMAGSGFGFGDIAGIHHLGLTSGLSNLAVGTHSLLLSHESLALIEVDENCNEVGRLSLVGLPQPEGVTMDNDGNIYIVSEPNRLYKYSNPTLDLNPVTYGSTVHATSTTGNSYTVPLGVLQENQEYCWRINDGNGWTNYWSFTTGQAINQDPTVQITSPTNGANYTNPGTITIQAAGNDLENSIVSIEFFVDGVSIGMGQQSGSTNTYEIDYTLINGTDAITALITDGGGKTATSNVVNITTMIPPSCPEIEITSPADGLIIFSASPINIVAAATDADGVIVQVEFFVNGQSVGTDNVAPYITTYNFSQDDVYTIETKAIDNDGCETTSDSILIQVGPNQLPDITITNPAIGTTVLTSFQTMTINVNATDPDGVVSQVEFFVNGSFIGTDTDSPYEMPYNFNAIGTYEIVAIATDNAGATKSSDFDHPSTFIEVQITNFPPSTQVISPADGSNHTPLDLIMLEAEAEDPDGDIQHVEFFIDGASYEIDNEFPFLVYWQPPGIGTYVVTAIATDNDGVTSVVSEVTITIDYSAETTTSAIVSNINDDVEEQANDGSMYFDSSDLELGRDNNRGNQIIGLRFNGLNIPQGALITSAYIQFMADEADTEATTVVITGNDADDGSPFTPANLNLSSRPETSNSVSWTVPSWSTGSKGAAQRTPELKSIIQEIVGRNGYVSSSSIVVKLVSTGQRVAESRDGNRPNDAPELVITYTSDVCPPAGIACDDGDNATGSDLTDGNCGCAGASTNISNLFFATSITNGSDDVEERGTNGRVNHNSSDLELTYDRNKTGNQTIGLRFNGVFLPPGATIDSAYVQFTVDETRNSAGSLNIYAEATGDSQPFTRDYYNVSSRSKTAASVSWTPANWNTVGSTSTAQRTPDITSIIQEIIDRGDWDGLSRSLSIIINGTGKRVAESYEGSVDSAPKLIVHYTNSGAPLIENPNVDPISQESTIELREDDAMYQVNVFPNPAMYEVSVSVECKNKDAKEGQVSLLDLNGRIIQQKTFKPGIEQITDFEIESLTQGMYFIKTQINEYNTIHKIVKK